MAIVCFIHGFALPFALELSTLYNISFILNLANWRCISTSSIDIVLWSCMILLMTVNCPNPYLTPMITPCTETRDASTLCLDQGLASTVSTPLYSAIFLVIAERDISLLIVNMSHTQFFSFFIWVIGGFYILNPGWSNIWNNLTLDPGRRWRRNLLSLSSEV